VTARIPSDPHVEEELTALADGALPADRRAAVEAHLEACAPCRERRDLLASALAALAAAPPPPGPRPGFEQRFYARLAREREAPRGWLHRLAAGPRRWLVPAGGLAAAAAVAAAVGVVQVREDRLDMARHLDLLEDYVAIASLDSVESDEDVEVVLQLDRLEGRP
jgi:anti-sigma factor RsiW